MNNHTSSEVRDEITHSFPKFEQRSHDNVRNVTCTVAHLWLCDFVFCGLKHSITNVIREIKVVLRKDETKLWHGWGKCLNFRYEWGLNYSVHRCPQLRPQHLFTFVITSTQTCSCVLLCNSNQAVFSTYFHLEARWWCIDHASQYIWHYFELLHCLSPSEQVPMYSARRIDAILKEDVTNATTVVHFSYKLHPKCKKINK